MKSERRHELATNELADWIVHFPQWLKENRTTMIVAAVIAVGLIAYTVFFYSRQGRVWEQKQALTTALLEQLAWQKETVLQGKVQGLGVSDIFLSTAGSLGDAAAETENPFLSALAMIKRAEALRAELHYRPKVAEPDVQKYQLQQARNIYEQALEKAKGSSEIAAMAEYGIALCLEDTGDFEGAQKLYEKIADSAEYQGGSFAVRAKLRAKTLNNNKEKVFFAQVQKPEIKQPVEQQISEPLKPDLSDKLEAPLTETDITSQKDLDFNLAK
jgi:tetratricopeptide (TPR) repeat protein